MDPTREELEAMLADYVDGNLAGEELARAETFLASNPGVREVMSRLMVDSEAIRTLPRVTPPVADLSEDLRGQLERDMLLGDGGLPVARPRRFSTPALAIAAMLVVGLGATIVTFQILANRPQSNVIAANAPGDRHSARPVTPAADRGGRRVAVAPATREQSAARDAAPREETEAAVATRSNEADAAIVPRADAAAAIVADSAFAAPMTSIAPAPAALDVPGSAAALETIQLASSVVPSDVVDWVADHADVTPAAASKRSIVFIVESDDRVAAGQVVDQAAAFFASDPSAPGGFVDRQSVNVVRVSGANGGAFGGTATSAGPFALADANERGRNAPDAGGVMSNVTPPSPIGEAIVAAGGTTRPASQPAAGATTLPSFTTARAQTAPASQPTRRVDALDTDLFTSTSSDRNAVADDSTSLGVIIRNVPEAVAARWQSQKDSWAGGGSLIAYDVSNESIDRTRTGKMAFGGEARTPIPSTQPADVPTITFRDADAVAKVEQQGAGQLQQAMQQPSQMAQISGVPIQKIDPRLLQVPSIAAPAALTVDVYVVVRGKARVAAVTMPTTAPVIATTQRSTTQPLKL